MRRRAFIAGLAGAAARPFAARAQQAIPKIGFLRSSTEFNASYLANSLRNGLKEAGLLERQHYTIEARYADNSAERLPVLAAELARLGVSLIVADNSSALAVKRTTAIPLVFASGGDPVGNGLVPNLNRPGGNVTGVVFLTGVLGAKRLDLLHRLVPNASSIATIVHPGTPTTDAERRELQSAAQMAHQRIVIHDVNTGADIESAFASFASSGSGALLIGSGPFLNSQGPSIVTLATRYRLPVMYPQRENVVAGGLMSYGTSITDAYRQAGVYASRILKGEKPGDLPVIQSSKFELVINLKTAKTLGLEFHPQLLATADEVIE